MNRKLVIGALILAILIFPIVVIQFTLTKADQGPDPRYMFKARIQEKLGETKTLTETFQHFLVETLEGAAPTTEIVILVSSSLSRGQSNVVFQLNQEFWGYGWLMDPEKYTAEHYLFFDQPQVYLWQIKGSVI